jgi:hypothetical protein
VTTACRAVRVVCLQTSEGLFSIPASAKMVPVPYLSILIARHFEVNTFNTFLSHSFPIPERVSCRVVSCRVVSCRVVSCRVVSCRVVSCA